MPTLSPASVMDGHKAKEKDEFGVEYARIPSWRELTGEPHFQIGIVVESSATTDRHIAAISRPASMCSLASVVVLHPSNEEEEKQPDTIDGWLDQNHMHNQKGEIKVRWGQEGFNDLLESSIDAVYIIVPPGSERDYVLSSLKAGKHVLLNDPLSTSLGEFIEQEQMAKECGKFVQFLTMFVHQYRVRRFIDRILYDEGFGRINSIESYLRLCYDDVEKVGVSLPLKLNEGTSSIRVLGRFCVPNRSII